MTAIILILLLTFTSVLGDNSSVGTASRDYINLTNAEDGEDGDFVTAAESETLTVYRDAGLISDWNVEINGSTTNSTYHWVWMPAPEDRHYGVANTGAGITSTDSDEGIYIKDQYTEIVGLEVRAASTIGGRDQFAIRFGSQSQYSIVANCYLSCIDDAGTKRGVYCTISGNTYLVHSTIIDNFDNGGVSDLSSSGSYQRVIGCTIKGSASGIESKGGRTYSANNLIWDCSYRTQYDYGTPFAYDNYNIVDDSYSGGGNSITSATFTTDITISGGDYVILSSTAADGSRKLYGGSENDALNAGTNYQDGTVSGWDWNLYPDINGHARHATTPDVGANEAYYDNITTTSIVAGTGNAPDTVDVTTVSWTENSNEGYVILDANAPSGVVAGDVLTDSAGVDFLIYEVSDDTLFMSSFSVDSWFVAPVVGDTAAVDEAHNTLAAWEDSLDSYQIYAGATEAKGECYDDGGDFDENLTIDGGIGPAIILTAPEGERHDGTYGTGATIVNSDGSTHTIYIDENANTNYFEISWLSVRHDSPSVHGGCAIYLSQASQPGDPFYVVRNCYVQGDSAQTSYHQKGINFQNATNDICYIMNNIVEGFERIYSDGIACTGASWGQYNILNNTIYNCDNNISYKSAGSASLIKNNMSLDAVETCYEEFGSTNVTIDYNIASDNSDSGANSLGADDGIVTADLITTAGSDFHLKAGSDAIDAGTDLGTSPSGVEIDIDGRDRDAEGDTWDIGAHEYVAPAAGTTVTRQRFVN
jgi:hypothetical protein